MLFKNKQAIHKKQIDITMSNRSPLIGLMVFSVVLVFSHNPITSETHINWHQWNNETLLKASKANKPILMFISNPWCSWCRMMDEETLKDSRVVEFINANFIAVKVDSEKNPAVAYRYLTGYFPTLAFLTAQGDTFDAISYGSPELIIKEAKRRLEMYHAGDETLIEGKKKYRERFEMKQLTVGDKEADQGTVSRIEFKLVSSYDRAHGGFERNRFRSKFTHGDILQYILYLYQAKNHEIMKRIAEKTMDTMISSEIYDLNHGGFFRSATYDWTKPHYEKLLLDNLNTAKAYLIAWQNTGKESYLKTANKTLGFIQERLYDQSSGLFYNSQVSDEKYYALPADKRLEAPLPPVSDLVIVANNAVAARVLLYASALLDDAQLRVIAFRILGALEREAYIEGKGYKHSINGKLNYIYLADQVQVALALLEAYYFTLDRRYLDRCRQLADYIWENFHDLESGGLSDYSSTVPQPGWMGTKLIRLPENAAAAYLYLHLGDILNNKDYLQRGERLCDLLTTDMERLRITSLMEYAWALDRLCFKPVEFIIYNSKGKQYGKNMLRYIASIIEPKKRILFREDLPVDYLADNNLTLPKGEGFVVVRVGDEISSPADDYQQLLKQYKEVAINAYKREQ